jgi:hypothetical protein
VACIRWNGPVLIPGFTSFLGILFLLEMLVHLAVTLAQVLGEYRRLASREDVILTPMLRISVSFSIPISAEIG